MAVSLFFSLIIYQITTSEIERKIKTVGQKLIIQEITPFLADKPFDFNNKQLKLTGNIKKIEEVLENEISSAKSGIAIKLAIINFVILIFSTIASYLFSGYVLKPIEENMTMQKNFISSAAHELRTPLTSLKTSLEVALRSKAIKKNKSIYDIIADNLNEVNTIISLSNRLLDLNKYQNDNNIVLTTFNIKDVIYSSVKRIKHFAENKNIKIKVKSNDIKLNADKNAIEEVLLILLDNAIKYTPKDGEICIENFVKKNTAVIKVSDTGIGIPKKYHKKIFERFFRVDSSRSRHINTGFGLGLSIAKDIIDLHNGNIKVESTPNQGSVFTIELPIKKA